MGFSNDPESRVDKEKVIRIIKWLIREEAENNKTNKRDDSEMIRMIAKHIQEEVKCL